MKKVTILDIALAAGVSTTAVSLVLNERPTRISAAKKAEIIAIAQKMNYVPNVNARALSTQKTNTIGLLIPDINNPFFSGLASAIENELRRHHYNVILVNSDDQLEEDIKAIQLLINRGVDGLLLTLASETLQRQDEMVKMLDGSKVPYVLIDRVYWQKHINYVTYNDYQGQYDITEYLINQGYKNIGFLAPTTKSFHHLERVRGYKEALSDAGLKVNDDFIINVGYRYAGGYAATDEVLAYNVDGNYLR